MASIRFNQIADARGSVNGTVYSRGIGGLYMKNRVSPINPQSTRQSAVRAQLSSLAASWRSLTDAQRDTWKAQVENYPATNRLGETYIPSGYQLYMTINSTLNAAEESLLTTPLAPASFGESVLDSLTITLTAGVFTEMNVAMTTPIVTGEKLIFELTGSLSQGISSPSAGLFKKVTVSAAAGEEYVVTSFYNDVYGIPTLGSRVFVKVYKVLIATGQRQLSGIVSGIVAGT